MFVQVYTRCCDDEIWQSFSELNSLSMADKFMQMSHIYHTIYIPLLDAIHYHYTQHPTDTEEHCITDESIE